MKSRSELKDEAYEWACGYIADHDETPSICVFEGMSDEQWNDHLEFIVDCFEVGLKPAHFLDVLIQAQKSYNDLLSE